VLQGAAEVSTHGDAGRGCAQTEIHGGTLLRSFAEAVFLEGNWDPCQSVAVLAILERQGLDEEDLFHVNRVRLSG
jgi:hypothetical protein